MSSPPVSGFLPCVPQIKPACTFLNQMPQDMSFPHRLPPISVHVWLPLRAYVPMRILLLSALLSAQMVLEHHCLLFPHHTVPNPLKLPACANSLNIYATLHRQSQWNDSGTNLQTSRKTYHNSPDL